MLELYDTSVYVDRCCTYSVDLIRNRKLAGRCTDNNDAECTAVIDLN